MVKVSVYLAASYCISKASVMMGIGEYLNRHTDGDAHGTGMFIMQTDE